MQGFKRSIAQMTILLAAVVAMATAAAGCGGGGDKSGSSSTAATGSQSGAAAPESGSKSGSGADSGSKGAPGSKGAQPGSKGAQPEGGAEPESGSKTEPAPSPGGESGSSGSSSGKSSGSQGSNGSSTGGGAKAQFIGSANKICRKEKKGILERISAYSREHGATGLSASARLVGVVHDVLLPTIETEIEKVAALSPPPGDEQRVEAALDAEREAVATVAALRTLKTLTEVESHFAASDKLIRAYGFGACANG